MFFTLTTPKSYITSHFADRYALRLLEPKSRKVPTFAYYSNEVDYITYSCGPDLDYDLIAYEEWGDSEYFEVLNIIDKIYDPSNGIVSNGDIVRTSREQNQN